MLAGVSLRFGEGASVDLATMLQVDCDPSTPAVDNLPMTFAGAVPGGLDMHPLPETVVFNTAHSDYKMLHFNRLKEKGLRVVLDGRNFLSPDSVRRMGLAYFSVGRPGLVPS